MQIILTLFLVANPIGNIPALVALVKDFDFEKQRKILFREGIFSLLIALFFLYLGEQFLQVIQIQRYAISMSGGILLFLVSLDMIFPPKPVNGVERKLHEPFIVPIATPLIVGGGVLSTIMILSGKVEDQLKLTLGLVIAWVFVIAIMVSSAYLNKILGKRGLLALEQLMGMLLCMLSIEIFMRGFTVFYLALQGA